MFHQRDAAACQNLLSDFEISDFELNFVRIFLSYCSIDLTFCQNIEFEKLMYKTMLNSIKYYKINQENINDKNQK